MITEDIKKTIFEYLELCKSVDLCDSIKYIYDNIKYDYELDDSEDLYSYIFKLVKGQK